MEESVTTKNPVEIELVVRNVFEYLGLEDLKSCRLVNSFWNNLSIPFLKRECGLISFNNDNYWTNKNNHDIQDMSKFVECVNASQNFPFVKFDIGTTVVGLQTNEEVIASFFQSTSHIVTELSIRDECGKQLLRPEIVEAKKFEFPLLETMKIHFVEPLSDDIANNMRSNFNLIACILKAASSLNEIVLVDHNSSDGKVVSLLIEALQESSYRKFSSLEIAAQIENSHLIQLSEMGLRLKSLHLDFWGSVIDPENLKAFLQSQSSTLESFKIADCAMSSMFALDFPCLGKLKTLMVKGSVLGRICISFPNISYVHQFPVLNRLSFSTAMDEWDEFLKFGIQPVNTVQELKLPSDFADKEGLMHAARLFPNIRKLEISAFLSIVNIVYDCMPNIEELILNTKYVDLVDDIITGLCASECEEILSFSEEMFLNVERDHMGILTTKPLSSLKRLKILRLKCNRQSDPVEITDVSCRLVLLKMKSLQKIDFWSRNPPTDRISQTVLNEMREKFVVYC